MWFPARLQSESALFESDCFTGIATSRIGVIISYLAHRKSESAFQFWFSVQDESETAFRFGFQFHVRKRFDLGRYWFLIHGLISDILVWLWFSNQNPNQESGYRLIPSQNHNQTVETQQRVAKLSIPTLKQVRKSWDEDRRWSEVGMMWLILGLAKEMTLIDEWLAVLSHGHEALTRNRARSRSRSVVDWGAGMVILGMAIDVATRWKHNYFKKYHTIKQTN